VSQRHNTNELPWWEEELPAIRAEQRSYLKGRLPALSADHEDLVNDALFALTKHVRRYSAAFPESWFLPGPPTIAAERSHLHKLATVILRRRISDLFRKRMPLISLSALEFDVADSKAVSPDRRMLLAKLLEVTNSALDEITSEDRDLIALISEDDGIRMSLNQRERQRLHRARKKLKKKIASRLGTEVGDLLK